MLKKSSNLAKNKDKMPKQNKVTGVKKKGKVLAKPVHKKVSGKRTIKPIHVKSHKRAVPDIKNSRIEKSSHIKNTNFFNNKFDVFDFLSNGVSNNLFLDIKQDCPFTDTEWATYLDISIKTLQRYTKDKKHIFKSSHSEKIIELLEVMNFGNMVFDTTEQFYQWLKTPNYSVGNTKPIELIKNSYGKELVMETLNRIEHGIFV